MRSRGKAKQLQVELPQDADTLAHDLTREFEHHLERLQKFDEIRFLSLIQLKGEEPIVMVDDRLQVGRAAVVEVRRMLPERAQWSRAVQLCGAPLRIARILADLRRIMQ